MWREEEEKEGVVCLCAPRTVSGLTTCNHMSARESQSAKASLAVEEEVPVELVIADILTLLSVLRKCSANQ